MEMQFIFISYSLPNNSLQMSFMNMEFHDMKGFQMRTFQEFFVRGNKFCQIASIFFVFHHIFVKNKLSKFIFILTMICFKPS